MKSLGYNEDMQPNPLIHDRIIILTHLMQPEAKTLARKMAAYLVGRGISKAEAFEMDQEGQLMGDADLSDCDLMIVIGGDGSMLRASHLTAGFNLPILGINQGRLGFLTELSGEEWQSGVDRYLDGNYRIENRMMLHGEHWREDVLLNAWDVLNDLVVVRGRAVRPITLGVSVGNCPVISYVADGLIIASPTGSTAYSLAVGGPILLPEMRSMIIIPISPHFSIDRAFVIPEWDEITIRLDTTHEAVISPDGKTSVLIENGDRLHVRGSEHTANFVRFSAPTDFYRNVSRYLEKNPIAQQINQS